MLGMARECRGCGDPFVQERAGQRYCNPACQILSNNRVQAARNVEKTKAYKRSRYDAARPWREFVCDGCGQTVKTQELRKRRFCSQHCKDVVRGREWQAANPGRVLEYRAATVEQRTRVHGVWRQNNLAQQQQYTRDCNQATRETTPWRTIIRGAKGRALQKGLPFDLTDEWAAARWSGKCELTGITFIVGGKWGAMRSFWPTIDKIEPSRGYIQDNCRFVLWAVNTFKGQDSDAVIYQIAEALLAFRSQV